MIEFAVFIALFIGDLTIAISGYGSFLLVLFPIFLFIKRHSLSTVLFVGGPSVLAVEIINNLLLGSLMLGVGFALLILWRLTDILNWDHPLTLTVCLFLYLSTIFLARSVLIYFLDGIWTVVSVSPFVITYIVGCGVIAYRLFHSGETSPQF